MSRLIMPGVLQQYVNFAYPPEPIGDIQFVRSNSSEAWSTPNAYVQIKCNGVITGDIIFAFVYSALGYPVVSDGWTTVAQQFSNTKYYALYYKVVTDTDPASAVWVFPAAGANRVLTAAYRDGFNKNESFVIDAISNTPTLLSGTPVTAASFSAKTSTLLYFGVVYYTSGVYFTPPTSPGNWSQDYNESTSQYYTTQSKSYMTVCSLTWNAAPGNTGDIIAQASKSVYGIKHAFAISLKR